MSGRALILTGISGVGKTAVGLRLQQILAEPWLFYEVDRTQPRLPDDRSQLATTETDNLLRRSLLRAARVYIDAGFSLIVEIGLAGDADQRNVEESLAGVDFTIVTLTCERDTHEIHLAARNDPVLDAWARTRYTEQTHQTIEGSHLVATDGRTISQVARVIADHLEAEVYDR